MALMISAYRSLDVEIALDDRTVTVRVPLTIGLLQRLEAAVEASAKATGWFRIRKSQTLLDIFTDFAAPYLPPCGPPQPHPAGVLPAFFFACQAGAGRFLERFHDLHARYGTRSPAPTDATTPAPDPA